jgi:MFS family permease
VTETQEAGEDGLANPVRRTAARTFGSLKVRNFRLFITGQLISVTGTWMQTVALGWLVLELTGSGVAVGVTLAFQFAPMLFFGLWGGLVADRYDKRRVLMWTQGAMGVIALGLWIVASMDAPPLSWLYGLVLMQGMVTVIDNPTRQSFVTDMVGRDLVANAVSLNSSVFNASRILGPSLAGVMIATVGLPWAFLLNAVSFIAVIAGLKMMDTAALYKQPRAAVTAGQIREGLAYVWASRRLRYTVAIVAAFSLFALNFSVVLPLLARFTFGQGAGAFGFLTSMMALGAVIGGLIAATRAKPTKNILIGSAASFGVLALLASMAPTIGILAALLVPIGACSITFISAANATLQLHSDPDMRGRVMALHGLVFLGSTPIGSPLIGWISETWGPRAGLACGGAVALLAALVALVVVRRATIEERLRVIVPRRFLDRSGYADADRKAG